MGRLVLEFDRATPPAASRLSPVPPIDRFARRAASCRQLLLCICLLIPTLSLLAPLRRLGLYLTLDVVFAPLMVWAVHSEVPPYVVLEGGGLLLSALLAHEAIALIGGSEAAPNATPKAREVQLSELGAGGEPGAEESSQPLMARVVAPIAEEDEEEAFVVAQAAPK